MAVKDKVLVSVGDIEYAWEIWETPQRMYESVTMVNMKFLRQRFFPSKMQEGTSVSQHLDKMEKILKEFVAVRVKMTDRDQCPESLLKSFESLTTTLSRETPPLTMIDLTIFFRQKLKRDLNSSLKRLMLRKRICFKRRKSTKWVQKDLKNIECWSCKKKGHLSFECP